MKFRKMSVQSWWRLFIIIVACSVVVWISYRYFGVNGEFTYSYYFNSTPGLISEFQPAGRALAREQNTENGDYYQRVVVDPVYFSVDLPSAYPKADVTIEYQNPSQSIVQLGLELDDDDTTWNYDFQPLENKFIDDSNWPTLENDKYVLLQREPIYSSVDDFLTNPPTDSEVGTFLASLDFPFIDKTYQPSSDGTAISSPLRGRHEIYTYIKDEALEFKFTYQDINYDVGPDPLKINIFHAGTNVFSQEWTDDGEVGITGTANGEKNAEIHLPDLQEGVYRIVLETNDDIIFTHIDSEQHKLVFKGRLHLAGSPEYIKTIPDLNIDPTTVISDADFLTIMAKHQYGLGEIGFYNAPLEIRRENVPYEWRNPIYSYKHTFTVPANDVEIITTGIFSFSEDAWFDPLFGFEPLSQYTSGGNLDYIISGKYTYPERIRGWTTATASFDITRAYREDPTKLDFILSAAGLDQVPQGLKVRAIHITAHKEPITFTSFWPRLKKRLFN